MKNTHYQEHVLKTLRRFLALLLAGAMLFALCACARQETAPADTANEMAALPPVVVEREAGSQELQTANGAAALALRYYIYARLKTEEFAGADFASMSMEEITAMTEEAAAAWETADALATGAGKICDRAIALLENSTTKQTASFAQPAMQMAASRDFDAKTWAESLTKQYDDLRGAKRYGQLAQQLGTDTKTAVEQMALAQEIIRNQAVADADFWDKMTKAAMATQTVCKVGLYVGATVATGGGSLAALAGSSMTLGTAGAVLVGGVSCIADVGATTSTIVLGENHQVTMDFQKAADVLQPASMVLGLVTLNPKDAEGLVALVGEYTMEWFNPGKITGIAINRMKEGGTKMVAQIVDTADKDVPGVRGALEAIGLSLPSEKGVSVSELATEYTVNSEMALASMRELAEQIGVQDWEAPAPDLEPQEVGTLPPEGTDVPPPGNATGAITAQEMAGNYSGTAALQSTADDVEATASLPVTLQLGEGGTGTVNVAGFSGEAKYAGSTVSFSVTAKQGGFTNFLTFKGRASRSGSQIVISGNMRLTVGGVTAATYTLTAQ